MIRHSVVFKLIHSSGSPEEREFLDEAVKLKSVPGVMKFEVMKQISSKNPYNFGISMEFEDQKSYDFYTNHPDHIRFVQEIWIPNVEIFMEIDYLV
ncbi:Dabb family protein [Algoriphagus sp. A40]|uniref:Dabb family protein n=1 Tax=Algoriphagus sp. A40 TaxID=1945863 RepID=UPI000987B2B0|nr:Dabb family protein [Algoriphagus sp. A40]OOG73822.1 stress responsive alpha-beta barrel domain-containing protein [Algoriphagus sp. A40]